MQGVSMYCGYDWSPTQTVALQRSSSSSSTMLLLVGRLWTWLVCTLVLVHVSSQQCPLPTRHDVEQVLVLGSSLPGSGASPQLLRYNFTCLAVTSRDMYSSISVEVEFKRLGQSAFFYTQFQMFCANPMSATYSFYFNSKEGFENNTSANFDLKKRRDCSSCTRMGPSPDYDGVANCVECSDECQAFGMGSCQNNNPSDCCPFFDASGSCINHPCVGNNPCQNGGVCNITNPRVIDYVCSCVSPYGGVNCAECMCKNGGTCEKSEGSGLDELMNTNACDCPENFSGELCEECINTCEPGYRRHLPNCSTCVPAHVCVLDNPCLNGGKCIMGSTDTEYHCICAGNFTGSNCNDGLGSGLASGDYDASGDFDDIPDVGIVYTLRDHIPAATKTADPSSTVITITPTLVLNDAIIWPYITVGSVGGVVVAFAAFLFILVCFAFVAKRRRKEKKNKEKHYDKKPLWPWMMDDGTGENATELARLQSVPMKRELSRSTSFLSKTIRILEALSRPILVKELEKEVVNEPKLHAEFMSILPNMVSINQVPTGAEEKNRYRDVLPNPHSRVPLFLKFGIPHSDYINANYVRGYNQQFKNFIATQAPLPSTIIDFWRMVWEQKCSVIVMVTNLVEENGKNKCCQYWPDPSTKNLSETHGELEIISRTRTSTDSYTVTTLLMRHQQRHVTREVIHYWYTKWPDHGVPDTTEPFINFVLETRKAIRNCDTPGPVVVHCSSGISRTGVFIAADTGMRELEEKNEVDVLNIVSSLRQDRGGMVQTKDQYVFLHKIFFNYARQIGRVSLDTTGLGFVNQSALEEESGFEDNEASQGTAVVD